MQTAVCKWADKICCCGCLASHVAAGYLLLAPCRLAIGLYNSFGFNTLEGRAAYIKGHEILESTGVPACLVIDWQP